MEDIADDQAPATAEDWRAALERVVPCCVVLKYVHLPPGLNGLTSLLFLLHCRCQLLNTSLALEHTGWFVLGAT